MYSEPSQTSKMKLFAKIIKGFQQLTIFVERSILDVQLCSEYACETFFEKFDEIPWKNLLWISFFSSDGASSVATLIKKCSFNLIKKRVQHRCSQGVLQNFYERLF